MARQAEPARHAQGLLSRLVFTALRKAIGLLSSAARSAAIARIDFDDGQDGQGGMILEFGTGSGDSLGLYPAGARVIGVDWRAEPLALAAARMRRLGIHKIGGLAVASPAALPFEDGAFETALASFALAELDDPSLALDELVRAVGPGGDIIIVDNFAHLRGGEGESGLAALIARPDL
ncbi:MAG: class I SAM-dependent methyltransferase, partial [Rhizobiales bacterium]|nr:class I SAM-dependent methyltransferase [Hyphomicrobiales bacterium]